MARALITGVEGPGFRTQLKVRVFQNLFVLPAVIRYQNFFRAGEGKGGEEGGWRPTSVTTLPVLVGSPATTSPAPFIVYGSSLYFLA